MSDGKTVEAAIERALEKLRGAARVAEGQIGFGPASFAVLRALVSEVQQAEREECAKVADERAKAQRLLADAIDASDGGDENAEDEANMCDISASAAERIASAIRSRGSASEGNKKGGGE